MTNPVPSTVARPIATQVSAKMSAAGFDAFAMGAMVEMVEQYTPTVAVYRVDGIGQAPVYALVVHHRHKPAPAHQVVDCHINQNIYGMES